MGLIVAFGDPDPAYDEIITPAVKAEGRVEHCAPATPAAAGSFIDCGEQQLSLRPGLGPSWDAYP